MASSYRSCPTHIKRIYSFLTTDKYRGYHERGFFNDLELEVGDVDGMCAFYVEQFTDVCRRRPSIQISHSPA